MVYDVAVIGGGPGGYIAAKRAGHAGLSVVLFEKRALGGVCLNEGCIPSKTLLHSAKLYDCAREDGRKYGVRCENATLDHAFVVKRKNRVVAGLVGGVKAQMEQSHVRVVCGHAEILEKTDGCIAVSADGETCLSRRLIIAAGAETVIPPIPGVKEGLANGFVLTSRELLDLPEIPATLAVIGGGAIGLEMASYFASAGSRVTVLEALGKIAGPTDPEISAVLQKNLEKKGIAFELGAQVTALEGKAVAFSQNGEGKRVPADKVLLSAGRRAALGGFGLEALQIGHDRGGILVDDCCRTNIANVYAVGDCTGRSLLAHTAYRQGEVAVNHILGIRDRMRYDAIPAVIYTSPEVAGVGLTEESARQKGIPVSVIRMPMAYSGRYVAENEGGAGVCKLLFHGKSGALAGAHIIGGPASEFVLSCGMMIEQELTAEEIKRFVFPHPTVCEIIREAVFAL